MVSLNYIFKKYGKEKIINWIKDYYTQRINNEMLIDKIIYILDSWDLLNEIEEDYKNLSDYTKYIILGSYFIK